MRYVVVDPLVDWRPWISRRSFILAVRFESRPYELPFYYKILSCRWIRARRNILPDGSLKWDVDRRVFSVDGILSVRAPVFVKKSWRACMTLNPNKDMQNSGNVRATLSRNAMEGNIVLIMMCNRHHLPLLLNAVYSLKSGTACSIWMTYFDANLIILLTQRFYLKWESKKLWFLPWTRRQLWPWKIWTFPF